MGLQDKSYKRFANSNFLQSFYVALQGIRYAIRNERNIRFHLLAMLLVVLSGFIFGISKLEWLVLCLIIGMVLALEMINTSIEAVVDLVMGTRLDPLAKIAKDVAAAAVLIAAFTAIIVGLLIFGPYLIQLVK